MKRLLVIVLALCFFMVGCTEKQEIKSMTFRVPSSYSKVSDSKTIKKGECEIQTKKYKKGKSYISCTYEIYHKYNTFNCIVENLNVLDNETNKKVQEKKTAIIDGYETEVRKYQNDYIMVINGPDGVYKIKADNDNILETVKFK